MTKNMGRLKRMEKFVEQHLWREESANEALNQEINRLSTDELKAINSLDKESQAVVFKLFKVTCEYKRALRLALTIADGVELPTQDPKLVTHTFKLADKKYKTSKRHSARTSISNSERPETPADFYRPYLEVAFIEFLYENGGKTPGRSKLEYATRKLMKDEGVSHKKINGLTDNETRKFLAKRKAARTPGQGLISRLIANTTS